MLMLRVHKQLRYLECYVGLNQDIIGPRARFKQNLDNFSISLRNSNFLKFPLYSVFFYENWVNNIFGNGIFRSF
jgi:hypothetical protein